MKKKMMKWLALAGVLCLGAGVLASCGGKGSAGDGSGEKKADGKTALSLAIWDEKQRPMTVLDKARSGSYRRKGTGCFLGECLAYRQLCGRRYHGGSYGCH